MIAALHRLWDGPEPSSGSPRAWYAQPRCRHLLLLGLLSLLLCNAALSIFFKVTDFEWHLREGQRFWSESPFDPRFLPYPLPRILLDGLFVPLGGFLARALAYLLALGLLAGALTAWQGLAAAAQGSRGRDGAGGGALDPALGFAATAFALLVLHPYLARDLNDCGPHITTMTLAVLALVALMRERPLLAGLCLATAAVWAATPLLFLPYLLLKRQWRAATAMLACMALWLLLPALVIGWPIMLDAYGIWLHKLALAFAADDLTTLPYEPARHQSQALRMVFARYLMSFGPEHSIHLDNNLLGHPLFLQFIELPARTAKTIYGIVLLLSGAAFAWRFRRPLRPAAGLAAQPWILPEWALVLLLMPLLAPTAWLHHFTVVLPAAVLVARHALLEGRALAAWRKAALAFIVVVLLLLQRDVVQRELSILVLSYKFDAFAVLLLAALTLTLPQMRNSVDRRLART